MDLRPYIHDRHVVDAAKAMAIEGLISYQPLLFADDFEVGVGLEFEEGRYLGLVHYPDIPAGLLESPELARRILPIALRDRFSAANRRLAEFYDSQIDEIARVAGDVRSLSFLDVGCNNGYLPIRLSQRGAALAAGCDRQDFSRVFSLLNGILDTRAEFIQAWYEPSRHGIDGVPSFDVVSTMAMVCHVADPLHLIRSLSSIATRALFVWTLVSDDDEYVVRYGEPRGDYPTDGFPYCFDNMTVLSAPLMRRSLELCGFGTVVEIPAHPRQPSYGWKGVPFRGFMGIR